MMFMLEILYVYEASKFPSSILEKKHRQSTLNEWLIDLKRNFFSIDIFQELMLLFNFFFQCQDHRFTTTKILVWILDSWNLDLWKCLRTFWKQNDKYLALSEFFWQFSFSHFLFNFCFHVWFFDMFLMIYVCLRERERNLRRMWQFQMRTSLVQIEV